MLTPTLLCEVSPEVFNKETPNYLKISDNLKLNLDKEKEGHLPLIRAASFEFHG